MGPEVIALARRRGKGENDTALLKRARGRYALLLNEDSELHPGAVAALRDALETRDDAAAAGARLLRPDGTVQPSAWRFPSPITALVGGEAEVAQGAFDRLSLGIEDACLRANQHRRSPLRTTSGSARFATIGTARPPSASIARTVSASDPRSRASGSACNVRATRATAAPSAARRNASATPMPRLAPVTSATRPRRGPARSAVMPHD